MVARRAFDSDDRLLWHEAIILADAVAILTGTAAAAGIAWINALGNLAGTVTPFIVDRIKDVTGNFSGGLYTLAGFALLAAIVTLVAVPERRRQVRFAAVDTPAE